MEFFSPINEFQSANNRITTEISSSTNPTSARHAKLGGETAVYLRIQLEVFSSDARRNEATDLEAMNYSSPRGGRLPKTRSPSVGVG
jgi:hypothetical protein